MSMVVYAFLAAAMAVVFISIWYYWNYARKIDEFLVRDNQNNNMMRQDLVDSFLARGEQEWPCSICYHYNHPNRPECIMCGTPQVLMENNSFLRVSKSHHSDIVQSNASVLNQMSRIRSFHVRRLKQMNLTSRQKAAVRRHLWQRKKGPDGALRWVRIDMAEAVSVPIYAQDVIQTSQFTNETMSQSSFTSITSSLREVHENVAQALLDFGDRISESEIYDGRRENTFNNSFAYTEYDESDEIHIQPLRATALQQLEEAEERKTLVASLYQSSTSPQFGQSKRNLKQIQENEEAYNRRDNLTDVSTGYVRHDDGYGGVEWTPVISTDLSHHQPPPEHDLEAIASLTFHEKNRWFLRQVQKNWRNGENHIRFVVRRTHLLSDSMEQMLKCPASRFWERLRIYFENEPGLDAGGLIREWYELLSDLLFSDEFGLFQSTKGERFGYWINASSVQITDHLLHYEFVGRLIGKALIEGYNMKVSLALPLIKHLLGVPISFSDLEYLDEDLHKNVCWIKKNDHAEVVGIDFTVQQYQQDGSRATMELKPNGRNIEVNDDNKKEYMELLLKYHMFSSISEQLTALLKGLYDIVPAYLLTVFDYQEFDLLLSGIPVIDVDDWVSHTEVRWVKLEKPTHAERKVLQWFWTVLKKHFTAEDRARLLQFSTGTSRVPVQGFKALTSSDGRVRRFTIQFVQRGPPPAGLMPKGHTCFNRIDIPLYQTQEELIKYLTLVINMEISGFWME
ncbi:unnamed protein product [Albugo candida]|nr:unnamed protein product [Albugo candida]|eukprot:CCI44949.1 unnamed protein product [Albugo candida]